MNENSKTLILVAAAVLLAAVAWFTRPVVRDMSPADMVGKKLFPEFVDPLSATSLEVVRYNVDTAEPVRFKVAQVNGIWSIPSHENYPADAEDHLGEAAADLMDLEVASVAATGEEEGVDVADVHKTYGVLDPTTENLVANEGVGSRVVMRDKDDRVLLDLIIGKEDPDQADFHFVRYPDKDGVYAVKVSTTNLSTDFDQWIEPNLLDIQSWDMRQVGIDDYSIDELSGGVAFRGNTVINYDDTGDPKWSLEEDRVFKNGSFLPREMGENEELNTENLDELKNALDDLKIVNVSRKSEALAEALRTSGTLTADVASQQSLQSRGYYFAQIQDPNDPGRVRYELLSNEGQVSVTMKDGISYLLRFGNITGSSGSDSQSAAQSKEEGQDGEEDEDSSGGANRYLFIMAELDDEVIEKPEFEEVPELPSEEAEAEESAEEPQEEADADEGEDAEGEEKADADQAKEDPPADEEAEATDQETGAEDDAEKEEADEEADAEESTEADAEKEEADAEQADAEEKEEEEKPSVEEIQAEIERIEKDNQRKQDEYDEKIAEAEKRVKELNDRFADWYYIISEDVYSKIHLSHDQLIKEKDAEDESEDADAGAEGGLEGLGDLPGLE